MDERPTSDPRRPAAGGASREGMQPASEGPEGEPGGVQNRPTAQQVADRVYELLCQDLRLERERRGR